MGCCQYIVFVLSVVIYLDPSQSFIDITPLSISLITVENGTWNKNLRFQDQKEIKRIYHMDYVVESYLLSVHFNF